jgi:hypothetical protein
MMGHHPAVAYPAGLVAPGDRLVLGEGPTLTVVDVREAGPDHVLLELEDGQTWAHRNGDRLTVLVLWPEGL